VILATTLAARLRTEPVIEIGIGALSRSDVAAAVSRPARPAGTSVDPAAVCRHLVARSTLLSVQRKMISAIERQGSAA
jgi:hypothetical protein